jgi:hypothetical protein
MLERPFGSRESALDARDDGGSAETVSPEIQALRRAFDRFPSSNGGAPESKSDLPAASGAKPDDVLIELVDEVRRDADTVGLLLDGSRAFDTARSDSNYDLLWIVDDAAYRRRSEEGALRELRLRGDSPTIEIAYESVETLRQLASEGGWSLEAFAALHVLVDKTGEIALLTTAITARAGAQARQRVAEEYDSYLNGFAHSLKSWSKGDDLGTRAHAAESCLHLVKALFGLEGRVAPYPDQWSARLAELDDAQGWQPAFFRGAVLRLLYAPDPPFQQMLERRVGRLMELRGIRHRWRDDLQRLRAARYDEL